MMQDMGTVTSARDAGGSNAVIRGEINCMPVTATIVRHHG